jgi:hypothetical protein
MNEKGMGKYQGNVRRTVKEIIRQHINTNSKDDLDERLHKRILTTITHHNK